MSWGLGCATLRRGAVCSNGYVDAADSYHRNYDGALSAAPEWRANVFYPADDALFFGNITADQFIQQIKAETQKFYQNKQ